MAKQWEVTGWLGELQMEWLRQHYDQATLDYALARLPKKGYPLNVARWLEHHRGGLRIPASHQFLEREQAAHETE